MQSDTLLLQSILDRISMLDAKVDHISERQVIIGERLDSHLKAEPATKSSFSNILGVLKTWVLPIVLAIFLLGRHSIEYTAQPMRQYPPNVLIGSASDDTFIANKNKKIDSVLLNQIMKAVKP